MRIWMWLGLLLLLNAPVQAGYTHHWNWLRKPSPEKLAACLAEMKLILEADKAILAGADGTGNYIVTSEGLVFNGKGEEEGHEPFEFPGHPGIQFCKTQWKTYDRTVVACLLVAADHFSKEELLICSDGSWEEWQAGSALYTSTLKRTPKNPLVSSDEFFGKKVNTPKPTPAAADEASSEPSTRTLIMYFGIGLALISFLVLIFKK